MTVTLSPFDIFLLVLGAATLSFGIFYAILRFGAWMNGRKW